MSRTSSLLTCSFVAFALVACGGAAEGNAPKSPSSVDTPSQEPQTIEEAQAQLERARTALGGAGSGAGGSAGATPSAQPTQPTQPPSSSTTAPPTVSPQMPQAGAAAQPTSTCDSVCRAVTSMHHAMDAICRLAGPADARCTDAKKKVADGDAQAASCSCPIH